MLDFRKFLTITFKDVRLLFTDRNALLIALLTPVVLTAVIGAAFSQFLRRGSNDLPLKDIPVAVVNEDSGTAFGNLGNTVTQILVPAPGKAPDPSNVLQTLLSAKTMNRQDAVAQVNS